MITHFLPHSIDDDTSSVSTLVPIFVGAIVVTAFIFMCIFCPLAHLYSTFGFPYCSGSSEFCCICSPYCYCAGSHLREDHTGTLKVLQCSDCCYSTVCGCKRPPPELLIPAHIRWTGPIVYSRGRMANYLGVYNHSRVLHIMQQVQQPIVTRQPTGGQERNIHFPV